MFEGTLSEPILVNPLAKCAARYIPLRWLRLQIKRRHILLTFWIETHVTEPTVVLFPTKKSIEVEWIHKSNLSTLERDLSIFDVHCSNLSLHQRLKQLLHQILSLYSVLQRDKKSEEAVYILKDYLPLLPIMLWSNFYENECRKYKYQNYDRYFSLKNT